MWNYFIKIILKFRISLLFAYLGWGIAILSGTIAILTTFYNTAALSDISLISQPDRNCNSKISFFFTNEASEILEETNVSLLITSIQGDMSYIEKNIGFIAPKDRDGVRDLIAKGIAGESLFLYIL